MGAQSSPEESGRGLYFFGVLLSVPVSLLLLLMIALHVGGCGNPVTPGSSAPGKQEEVNGKPTEIPIVIIMPTSNPAAKRVTLSRSSRPSPTLSPASGIYTRTLWFVWDRTRSMNRFCTGTVSYTLQRLPAFLAMLGYAGSQEKKLAGNKANLYVGVLQMIGAKSGSYTVVMTPTLVDTVVTSPTLWDRLVNPAMELQTKTPEPNHESRCEQENGYAKTLEYVLDEVKVRNEKLGKANKAAVVLFTDGTYIDQKGKVRGPKCEEEETRDILGQLSARQISTYVILCHDNKKNNDKEVTSEFWKNHVGQDNVIDVSDLMAAPKKFVDVAWSILEGFIPRHGGWIFKKSPYTFQVPADTLKVSANVVGLPVHSPTPGFWMSGPVDSHKGDDTLVVSHPLALEKWSNRYRIDEIMDGPLGGDCISPTFTVKALEGIGYAWYDFERPSVYLTAESTFVSRNDVPVPLTFSLQSPVMSYEQLKNRRDCYRVRLKKNVEGMAPQKDSRTEVPQEGKFVESRGRLESHWVWEPGEGPGREMAPRISISVPFELVTLSQKSRPLVLMDLPFTQTFVPHLKWRKN